MTLHSHLRMDGAWRVYTTGEPWRGRPAHLIRVVLRTLTTVAVGYHLHDLALVPTDQEETLVGHLGPDLLGSPDEPGGWDPTRPCAGCAPSPTAPSARPCWTSATSPASATSTGPRSCSCAASTRARPWRPVEDLPAVVDLAQRLLVANKGRWTQATTGSVRRGEEVYVYGRAGAPCRRCGTPIERETVGERSTYWCPACQPHVPARQDQTPPGEPPRVDQRVAALNQAPTVLIKRRPEGGALAG